MNIGNLYLVKHYDWFLFPSRGTAAHARYHTGSSYIDAATPAAEVGVRLTEQQRQYTERQAAYWSSKYKCEVTWFEQGSIVIFLEEDSMLKRVLVTDGRIGYTWFDEIFEGCFEEAKL